ncbi:MAG: hypothetical protein A2486_07150 [Burkholderiales bacterium RIFOXYC12_FULL_65_23]|uniref:hypothetical protein n=1 Tax=Malikia spinosa TaxID=86180 RepID=UPI0008BEAC60|nr:MAG: hypothetical protein A2486_07150 [Burkholderiales bacterium RIFOXYC12_FULL_65_23]
MSNINNGGPAFPIPLHPGQTYTAHALCDGMTLRDYFAAKVLPSVYSSAMDDAAAGSRLFHNPDWRIGLAIDAYEMADAMLRAREAA